MAGWLRLAIAGMITSSLLGCGIRDDPFHCRELCDKMRECKPTLSDPEWDTCYGACKRQNLTRHTVDCILTKPCEDGGFAKALEACYLDPALAGGDGEWEGE